MRTTPATIALLTDEYLEYRKLIIDQIARVLAVAGYGTLCIAGRELDPGAKFHQDYSVCNSIFSAARNYQIDGVVVLTGSLGGNTSDERLQSFVEQFTAIPKVSFGIELSDIPSVIMRDELATNDLYSHLLSQRQCRKLAFISGKANDLYSEARERSFRDEARKRGHPESSIFRVHGNYSAHDTYDAVTALLIEHPDIDIIAAANDHMAESAVRAVHACNMRIPEDVLITGFDDTKEATRVYPSITTVRQPLTKAATLCAQLMIDTIDYHAGRTAEPPPPRVDVDSELIVRGSTAAMPVNMEPMVQSQEELVTRLTLALSGLKTPDDVDLHELGSALWASLNDGTNDIERCLGKYLRQSPPTVHSIHWWSNACHYMESATGLLAGTQNAATRIAVIIAAIAGVRQHLWAISMNTEFDKRRASSVRTNMQLQMSSCAKQGDILDTMGRWLQQTDIDRCFLVKYAAPGPTPDEHAQLLHVYRNGKFEQTQSDFFETSKVLPEPYEQESARGLLIQAPIHAGHDLFGYLLVDPSELDYLYLESAAQSIGNALRNQYLIDQLEKQTHHLKSTNLELVRLANYDELTELPNRLQFNANLKTCCANMASAGKTLTLLFIDLDGFKLVNDTLGHRAGDQLLREVAQRLKTATSNALGKDGFIARLGGDEFTVTIMAGNSRSECELIANAILESLACPYTICKRTINISASIGMAEFPVDADTVEALVKNADSAMYRAKKKGKNCAAWYTAELSVVNDTLLQMDNDMRIALLSGDICMHYQPRVNMDTGRLSAVEALMRWTIQTPEGRVIRTRPDVFIAVAEKTGFITHLDSFALDESCRQAKAWDMDGTPLLVAVNVSVLHLQQDSFVETVLDTLARHQLSPYLLELEITESAMMTQVDANVEKLHQLRSHGIQLSIDDFGTGYSSLSYLKQLPVNNLKIDKSFIADIDALRMRRSADAAIIKSVIALGRSMDFQIIAEGIETESQRQFLRALGCHEAQGFLFARPAPASELAKLLRPVDVYRKSA